MASKITLDRIFTDVSSIEKLLLHYYGQNEYYAQAKLVSGDTTYLPVKQKLNEEIIRHHLEGKITLGSYQLNADSTVNWIALDVDSNNRETAREYTRKIAQKLKDTPHGIIFSGSKGYHIYIFLTSPMPAEKAKIIGEAIRGDLPSVGNSHVEVFPKQIKLSKATPMGSLIKIPLGLHPKTHQRSFFVDPNNGWENGAELDPIKFLTNAVDPSCLDILLSGASDPKKAISELLIPYWSAGERHNLALYLSGYLAHLGWGAEDAVSVIADICKATNDESIDNRLQAVVDTFKSIVEGKSVKGFSGLNDLLPGAVMRTLTELATQIATPIMVRRVDSVRLTKGATFEKVNSVTSIIWADLHERGEIIKTEYNQAYWFDAEEHLLVSIDDIMWLAQLHADYGLNPTESFGSQVIKKIQLKAMKEARIVDVRNRTVWDGERLYINLGGAEVYMLDGQNIVTGYNGECGYLFTTTRQTFIEPDFKTDKNIWDSLVNDISFNKSSEVPATPEEQAELLKAWILAFFFQELMPTKPLLLAMGAPGSGKTTAMRRIMRILDAPDAEVLEVVADKPDSLRTSLASHRLIVLDNLENSGVRWLIDVLNRLATGSSIELRELYKTNTAYVLKPQCFVAMTAVSMPFSEDTLFSRILPLEMQALANPMPEYFLQRQLKENMNGMWADLLLKLNQIVDTLKRDQSNVPPIASRLADFSVFCSRISKSGVVNGTLLIKGLRSLVDRQKMALLAASPFIDVLEDFLSTQPDEADKYHSIYELYAILEPIARNKKLRWEWKNAMSLGRHVITLKEQLEKLYQADVQYEEGKEKFKVRFKKLAI
jgi:hypothetical protein